VFGTDNLPCSLRNEWVLLAQANRGSSSTAAQVDIAKIIAIGTMRKEIFRDVKHVVRHLRTGLRVGIRVVLINRIPLAKVNILRGITKNFKSEDRKDVDIVRSNAQYLFISSAYTTRSSLSHGLIMVHNTTSLRALRRRFK